MTSRSITPAATIVLILVFAAFGGQQVAVKLAVSEMGPITQAAVRSIGGAILLAAWFGIRRTNPFRTAPGPSAALGLLFALDFGLLYVGIEATSAAHATVLYYTAPMIMALAAMTFIGDEGFDTIKSVGIAVAFTGVAVIAFAESGEPEAATFWGDLFCFAAAICWAATILVIRATDLREVDPGIVLFHQLFGSIPLLGMVAWGTGETWPVEWTATLLASLIFQTVGVAFVSYLVFFEMLRRYPTTHVSAMSFLAPVFGVIFAVLILEETLAHAFWVGAVAIISGLFLTNKRQ